MENIPSGQARQTPNVETQRAPETCEDGQNTAVKPAEAGSVRLCEVCGNPDCPGAKSANVWQAIRRGRALDVPPYGFTEAWCHGGGRMLLPGLTEESNVVTDIIWWRGGRASWRNITDWLNERGIRMRDGGAWTWTRVRAVAEFVYYDQWLLVDRFPIESLRPTPADEA